MPSAETQTAWSWIQDVLLVAQYKDTASDEWRRLLISARDKADDDGMRMCTRTPEEGPLGDLAKPLPGPRDFPNEATTPPSSERATFPPTQSDPETTPLRLPPIGVPASESSTTDRDFPFDLRGEESAPFAAILDSLRLSSGESSDDDDNPAGAAKLTCVNLQSVPLPAVLQYLRESEALASKYFSISAKGGAKRGRRPHLRNPTHPLAPSGAAGTTATHPQSSEGGEAVADTCHFCGKTVPRLRLLGSLEEDSCPAEITSVCCDDYKQFSILVAASMRRMIQKGRDGKSKRINITSDKKSTAIQKTAEQRALAMMIRKRKWEELKNQKQHFLQSSSFHTLTKHTKTIEFTLLSPKVVDGGWMVSHAPPEGKDQRETQEALSPKPSSNDVIRIPEASKFTPVSPSLLLEATRPLKVQLYQDGRPYMTILPDLTGQCYYPSGRVAIMIYAISQGAMGYLVFEDEENHTLLAMLEDGGGQVACYGPKGSLRLLLTSHQATVFDDNQSAKRTWSWVGREGSTPLFQPISLQLNKAVVLRCSQKDSVVLSFSAANCYTRFFVGGEQKVPMGAKLHDQEEPSSEDPLASHLQKTKTRISSLLGKLQYAQRLRRTHRIKVQ